MDPDSRLSSFIIVALLFVASAYFALTETAIAAVSRTRIKVAADKGDGRAKKTLYVLDHFDDAITTLLILTNIAHLAAAAIVTVITTQLFGLGAVTLSTVIMTLAMFFLGEMLPKSVGSKISYRASLACSGLLYTLMKICRPLARLLSGFGQLVLKLVGSGEEKSVTEEEIYDILEDMTEEGAIDEDRSELISSALQFGDVTVSSILTPRVDIACIDLSLSPEKVLEYVRQQTHSRILVYDGTIDHVIGILQIRKYLKQYISTGRIPELSSMLEEVFYVHQNRVIDDVFNEMSHKKQNLAVVNDSFGGTLGIITIEDIVEEIVGEIWDEDDEIKEPIMKIADNAWLVDGDETVMDSFDFIEYKEETEENQERLTNLLISDWVCEQLARIPKTGDEFVYGFLTVRVSKMDHNRVLNVTIQKDPDGSSALDHGQAAASSFEKGGEQA